MKQFSLLTKAYITSTLLVGLASLFWSLLYLDWQHNWMLLALSGAASMSLMFKIEGTTNRSHYNISFLIYGFTLALLGPEAAILVIVISNLVEWVWHKYPWYIQSFNIASFVIVTLLSGFAYRWINPEMTLYTLEGILSILTAMATFTLFNHLMIGLVVWLARGENFAKSGIFNFLPLMIDFILLCMGAGTALIWILNPFAIILAILPLYLIYSTLKVPALERQTETDQKTGLFNAKYLSQALAKELERAHRFDRPLTVVLADLDLLRNINNTYGHLAGDEVLIGVAKILKNSVREYDIVARFGGEEFAVLMPEMTPQEAYTRVDALRAAIEKAEFTVPTSVAPIKATMSFGIAGRLGYNQTPNDIVHNADSALYHAKLEGRNRTYIYMDDGFLGLLQPDDRESTPPKSSSLEERVQYSDTPFVPNPLRENGLEAVSDSRHQAPHDKSHVNPRPSWLLNLFIGSLVLVAALLFSSTHRSINPSDWIGIAMFVLIVIFTEGLSTDIYVGNTSVSTSAAPILAGTLLYGPLGAVTLSTTFALVAKLKYHSPTNRFIFNSANQMIAGLLLTGLFMLTGISFVEKSPIIQMILSIGSAGIIYLITTGLVIVAIYLDTGVSPKQVWKEKFSWLAPYYISMGLIAYAMVFGFQKAGVIGLFVILVPLLMLRLSQKQYIDRTTAIVNELREKNALLENSAQEITNLNEGLLTALAEVIDLRNPFVLGHSQHVRRYSILIAKKLGLLPKRIELIHKAGLLHDIGKLGIPDSILLKPAPLSNQEYNTIKMHTTLGAEILEKSHSLRDLVPVIRHHHERFDGTGYPDGLHGSQIPLEARIISVADAVEAMASDRPYRKALSFQEILEELKDHAGNQFDPLVVEAVLEVLQSKGESLLLNSAQKIMAQQPHAVDLISEAHLYLKFKEMAKGNHR